MIYCFAKGCHNAKSKSDCRDKTFFRFPVSNPQLLQVWLKNIKKADCKFSRTAVLCSDHFQENHFTVCPFTKRRKLKKDAIPDVLRITPKHIPQTILPSTLLATDENNLQLEQDGRKLITPDSVSSLFPNGAISFQERVETECEQISSVEETCQSLNSNNPPFVTVISNQCAFILVPSNTGRVPKTVSGIKSQNITGTSIVIKQKPVESVDDPPRLDIKEIPRAEEIASSTTCTSSVSSIPPLRNALAFANPNSTNKYRTPTQYFPNKSPPKKQISDTKPSATPDAAQAKLSSSAKTSVPSKLLSLAVTSPNSNKRTPNATQDRSCRRTLVSIPSEEDIIVHPSDVTSTKSNTHSPNETDDKSLLRVLLSMPSKDNVKVHASVVTPTKAAEFSTLPNYNDENATREMFESMLDGSESNHGSNRTTERPGDLFDVFADFIAVKLREMDLDDCACSIRAIMDVVFKRGKESEVKNDISSSETSSRSSNQAGLAGINNVNLNGLL